MPERFRGELLTMGHCTNPASLTFFTLSTGLVGYICSKTVGEFLCVQNLYSAIAPLPFQQYIKTDFAYCGFHFVGPPSRTSYQRLLLVLKSIYLTVIRCGLETFLIWYFAINLTSASNSEVMT